MPMTLWAPASSIRHPKYPLPQPTSKTEAPSRACLIALLLITLDHFRSERHSVSTNTLANLNGPLRQGRSPFSPSTRLCSSLVSPSMVTVSPKKTFVTLRSGRLSYALYQRSKFPFCLPLNRKGISSIGQSLRWFICSVVCNTKMLNNLSGKYRVSV